MPMDRSTLLEKTELSESLLDDEAKCGGNGAYLDPDDGKIHGDPKAACDRPAAWVGRPICGHPQLYCTLHREELDNEVLAIICACGTTTPRAQMAWARI